MTDFSIHNMPPNCSLELLFIAACCLATMFFASTLALLVVVCCFPNNTSTKSDEEIILDTISAPATHTTNSIKLDVCKSSATSGNVTVQDLINQLQTIQLLIQQQPQQPQQQEQQQIYTNNLAQSLPMTFNNSSPWNTLIQHQLTPFQHTGNSNYVLSAPGSGQQAVVQDNSILDYHRRFKQKQHAELLQAPPIRKKSRSDPIHYNGHQIVNKQYPIEQKQNYYLNQHANQMSTSSSCENLFENAVTQQNKCRDNCNVKPRKKSHRKKHSNRKKTSNKNMGEDSEYCCEISISAPLPISNPTSEDEMIFRRFVKKK
eukprot:99436_1